MKGLILSFIILILSAGISRAQIEDRFQELAENNIEAYAKPLITSLGTAMNSGGFYTASVPSFFGFSISFRGMLLFIPDDQKTFTPVLEEGYTANKETPTIYGPKQGQYYGGVNGYITMPPGIDISSVPVAYPQIAASLLGTEVILRLLPEIDINDENSVSLFGIGVKHSISRYIPLIPVDVAVQVLYNKFEITNLISVKNLAFNAHASKTLGVLTGYFGLQYESTTADLEYTFKGDPNSPIPANRTDRKITTSIDGDNGFRATIGASLKLAVIVLNIDYSLASQPILSGGLTFAF